MVLFCFLRERFGIAASLLEKILYMFVLNRGKSPELGVIMMPTGAELEAETPSVRDDGRVF